MAKKRVVRKKPPARAPRSVMRPQVKLEVRPGGPFKWIVAFNDTRIAGDYNKDFLIDIARQMKNDIARSGGRAELIIKDRKGRILKGPQGRDSGGSDPSSEG